MKLTIHECRRLLAASACWLAVAAPSAAVGQLPIPHAPTPAAPPGVAPAVQSYPIAGAATKGVAAKLKEMYGPRGDVHISDTSAGQVVVHAPHETQWEIQQWLAAEGLLPSAVQPAAALEPVAAAPQPLAMVTRSFALKHLNAKDFEARLVSTWNAKLQSSQDQVGDVATFRFPPTPAGTTSVMVDRRTNTATIAAPKSAATTWERLMVVLDSRPKTLDERTSIVPVTRADKTALHKAATLLQQLFNSASGSHRKQHIGQFVAMLFAQEGVAQNALAQVQPPPQPPADTTQAIPSAGRPSAESMEAIARINNVQIEILDDVIVVRGRREDVERVLQIIEQIEQQSIQFRPEIEVYYLKHADSTAISDMITQVYTAAFSRMGQVTIVPMQRPNALLLIGRKENIPSIVELISKLDQPAPTEGEFRVFRLENMSAIDAERTIRGFFITRPPQTQDLRPGMGTRALVIADYRTNSLLVQAAPRDMLEIAKLIETLDVAAAGTTNEVRVFKLRNAIAATLAPLLTEAITAAQASTQALGIQGAAQQATPPRSTPPSVSLQFLRVSPEGQELIRSGIMSDMRVTADAASNTLIVVGPAENMGLMEALIERLDQLPASEAQIKVFEVRNGDATALAEMLQNLFGVPAAGAQGAQPGVGTPTGGGDSAIVPLRFSVDQRTNSIIASGNAGDLQVIYYILSRLDQGDIRQRETAVYRLRNAPAQDVANALTQLLQQQLTLIQIAPELVTPVEQIERQVIVVPEIVTNSLIVSATSRYFREISRIIETLDRRPPMVVIQVVLAEVALTDTDQFGIEWGLQDALMFDRSASATGQRFNFEGAGTAILPNDATPQSLATRNNVATQGLANFSLGRVDPTLGWGGLVLTASSESVSVLLRALEQSSRAQIISRPQVQTLDNLPAFVQVGALVPRITGASTTGLSVVPIVNDINVGLIMQVTPRTSPDGTIVMQVYAEKSSVGPDSTAIPISTDANGNVIRSPQIPRTLAQTTVSARSGQTVILGGLITNDQQENTRRVPYLADIPVLGRLFRFDAVTKVRTELLIILTPYLVTSDEQIEWINARESERMSWCIADIVNIHGPVGLSGNPAFNASETPLIFPDLDPNAPPVTLPHGPILHGGGYPAGRPPYQEEAPRQPDTTTGAPPPPPTTAPLPPNPTGYPPGIPPYTEPPLNPPGESIPPLAPPGFGSSRRAPEGGVIIPQPPSLMPPAGASQPGPRSPAVIQPAQPPVGTGVSPASAAFPAVYSPQPMQQLPPINQ